MDQEDSELVTMPLAWCEEIAGSRKMEGLPEDLYNISEAMGLAQMDVERPYDQKRQAEEQKPKWGPTMMEIAQEWKKITNLERVKGIPKHPNPFSVLSSLDVVDIANNVGISLGLDDESDKVANDIVEEDRSRARRFSKACVICQVEESKEKGDDVGDGGAGGDAPITPVGQMIKSQGGFDENDVGQWTCVVHRKKTRPKLQELMGSYGMSEV
jgi:hypothetical protein